MSRTMSPLTLAYSILVGPILWFVHFMLVYAIAEFGCRANFNNLVFLTPENMRLMIFALTVVALLGVGAGGVLAFRGWQIFPAGNADQNHTYFLVVAGMLLSSLFLLSIVFTALPTFFLNVCDKAV